jgi:hypothetical protein
MNCSMTNVTMTGRDGAITSLEQVFIRGALIRFVIIPDILKNAPMFKRIDPKQVIRLSCEVATHHTHTHAHAHTHTHTHTHTHLSDF